MGVRSLISILAIAGQSAGLAAQPLPSSSGVIEPIRPWVVHFDETSCYAERAYGMKDDPVTLAFEPAPDGNTYEMVLGRKGTGPLLAEQRKGVVDFGSGPLKIWALHYSIKGSPLIIDKFSVASAEIAQTAKSPSVTIRIFGQSEQFALQSMPGVLATLNTCNDSLRDYWNMGEVGEKRVAQRAVGDLRSIFKATDYPQESATQEGSAQFLLFVDEKGSVAACHLAKPSYIAAFDAMGCQVIQQRARFTPARDGHGTAVRSAVVTPLINWRLGPS